MFSKIKIKNLWFLQNKPEKGKCFGLILVWKTSLVRFSNIYKFSFRLLRFNLIFNRTDSLYSPNQVSLKISFILTNLIGSLLITFLLITYNRTRLLLVSNFKQNNKINLFLRVIKMLQVLPLSWMDNDVIYCYEILK